MIQVEHLSKSFNGQKVLEDIDFTVAESEIVAILGESGTGKSVLLKHMIGLLKPDTGRVFIDGTEISSLPEKKLLKIRQKIGYLFQEGALYDFMNVFENIAFPLKEHTKLDHNTITEKVKSILGLVGLEGVEKKLPSELSGGMKKRVGLARSIIMDSKILFCDEPTSGLDPIRSREISDLILQVSKKFKSTIVFTSHDIANSFSIAHRLILLRNGKIFAFGRKEDLLSSSDPFIQEFIK